ncbi:MAG TPA: AgmX/PglI C-terminal domain-containing protein [Anaeromyxobacter sp.]|nr:AgmX/PglI C-terminal domain-containing protein [Anaeromyxobacter sp.]
MAAQQAKVLRVGVVRSGKIVEERILPLRQSITIGTSSRNTFVVQGSTLPASVPVFAWQGERCLLAFAPGVQGRIQGPQGEADLPALVAQGLAAKQGASYVVPIREDQRGKLVLEDVTLLWQFVAPTPEAPRPTLTKVNRGNHFSSMDRLFVTVLLVSLAIHSGFYVAMAATSLPEKELTLEEIPDRYARVLIPERRPEPPPPAAVERPTEAVAETKPEEKKPEAAEKKGEPGPESKAAHAAAVAKAVQSKGILKVLGALGPGTGHGAVADVFGTGGGVSDVATALAGAGGVAVATDPSAGVGGRKGGGQGGSASIGSLATSGGGGGQVGYGAKAEVKVTGSVAAEAAEIDSSDVDQGKLGAFVRARMGLLKACYENALKRNPGLKGRMRIRFTILETGGISELSVVENGLGSQDVATCVASTMRAWRLPFRPSGPVSVDYPLVFSPGG